MNDFLLISSTENKQLSELEIELENLKMEREELKTKLQCFEEKERLGKWKTSEAVEQLTLLLFFCIFALPLQLHAPTHSQKFLPTC